MHYRSLRTGAVYHAKHKRGKYAPHYGTKESAKFAARPPEQRNAKLAA